MTIDIPVPEDLSLAWWQWTLIAALAWYVAVAVLIRVIDPPKNNKEREDCIKFWLISPVALPLLLVVGVVWTILWVVSLGLVPAPWQVE